MKPEKLFTSVIERIPDGLTKTNTQQAARLSASTVMEEVVETIGNGSKIIAYDTVPFCLWCAFHNLNSYTEALWTCVSGGGDVDTNCAIVGGIVALAVGREGIPDEWANRREHLPFGIS